MIPHDDPTARLVVVDPDARGLPIMVADLIRQNLERDPSRRRLLHPSVVAISVPDAGVGATVRIAGGVVHVVGGADPRAPVRVRAGAEGLLALAATPLRWGLPDVRRPQGRAVIADLVSSRLRVRGLSLHPLRVARFTRLLSVQQGPARAGR
jgi:hypothetical protein